MANALQLPEVRVLNLGIDLTRSFLQMTQKVVDSIIGVSVEGLDAIESKLPDVPLVSRPGAPGAYRSLPPGRMLALGAARGFAPSGEEVIRI